jgi:hypothetical protein
MQVKPKNLVEWGGNTYTLWGRLPAAWQTFITAGFTAATAWLGIPEVGLARAIFYSSGVLAFGMTTVFLGLRIGQILGMFQRLSLASFGISSTTLNTDDTKIEHLNLFVVLRNDSQRPMFYRLKRMHVVLERTTPVSETVDDKNIIIIPAFGGTQQVSFSTIEKVPLPKTKAPEGSIEVEIEYGSSAADLDFQLREVVTMGISIFSTMPIQGNGKSKNRQQVGQKQVQLMTAIRVLEHSKSKGGK